MKNQNSRNPKIEILDSATQLFFDHGYRVGIDRIIAEARVAKMTFYKYFPSKTQLISAVIARVHHRIDQRMRELAAEATHEPLGRAQEIFSFLCQSMTDVAYLGALIPQALVEIHEEKNESRRMAHFCTGQIIESMERACLKANIRCAVIARQLHGVIIGGQLLRQVLSIQAASQATEATIRALLHLTSKRGE